MSERQTDLPLFKTEPGSADVDFLVSFLDGKDWLTATEILEANQLPVTDSNKRKLRAAAEASGGRVAGGQRGYKLVKAMTKEEFDGCYHWMNHQAELMKRRCVEMSKVFYGRAAVETGVI